MESKKIFLSQSYIGNYKAYRLLYLFLGLTFIATGLLNLNKSDIQVSFRSIFSITQGLYGFGALVYSIVLLSPQLKFAPRFEFFDNEILIKKDVLVSAQYVKWKEVESIKYGSYEVSFTKKEGAIITFPIFTKDSDNSIAIKEEITIRAKKLGIEVVAG